MSRIGLIGDNSVEYIKKLLHIWNSGDCAVLIDWRIPISSAMEMMNEANVSKCYMDIRLADRICNDFSSEGIEFIFFEDANRTFEYIPEEVHALYYNNYCKDEAIILYSSGTTGKAKGIILTHYAINVNADLILEYMDLSEDDCLYIVKTLAHSSTLVGELLVGLKVHTKILLAPTVSNPRNTLQNIGKYCVTTMCVNPTLLKLYIQIASNTNLKYNHLKTIYTSGAIAEESLIAEAKKVFKDTEILNVYGLSEAGPRVSAQRKGKSGRIGSVGTPLKNVDVAIVSDEGKLLSQYEKGIIHVNTPCLFKGYVSGKVTRKPLYNDWFNTGDVGYMDDKNNLFITGRADNMIIIGSHNVYPEEIENQIMKVPDIKDCIIIGVKDNIHGCKMICYYVAESNLSTELRAFCVDNLASYEVPSIFKQVAEIPKTSNGKKARNLEMRKIEELKYE